jgi:hypothetical protein
LSCSPSSIGARRAGDLQCVQLRLDRRIGAKLGNFFFQAVAGDSERFGPAFGEIGAAL